MKWGRTYQMTVQGETEKWLFGSPFTLRFSTVANGTPTTNTADFFIYNLPDKIRNDISMDIYQDPEYRQITFSAGYNDQASLKTPAHLTSVFVGNVFWAYSYRQGPDWITQLHCVDGGGAIDIANVEVSFASGTTMGQVYRTLCQAIKDAHVGVTGFVVSKTFDNLSDPRGITVSGNPWETLVRQIIPKNAQLYINKGIINIILQNEYVPNPGGLVIISPDTGLIGSPRRQGAMTIATMIFEPTLEIGQNITLQSIYAAGENKLLALKHYGVISESECGDAITEATFLRPDNLEKINAATSLAA